MFWPLKHFLLFIFVIVVHELFFLFPCYLEFFISVLIILVLNNINVSVVEQLLYCRGGNFYSFCEVVRRPHGAEICNNKA